jgi:Cu-processing system ATP-binding protein
MITIRNVAKRFGALEVLRSIDLDIRPGRITALVGPNAAGKTTLLKSVLGLTRVDAGSMLFDGKSLGSDPSYRRRIGYMPQSARFPDHLTGHQLMELMTDLRDASPTLQDHELIERFALGGELAKPLRTLSGGTKQKVNAVIAFLFDPDLLILDEPTAGLDPVASGVLKDKIARSRAAGKTFILTSHIMSELEELADDVAFLLDGRVRFAGDVHDLKVRTRQFTLERAIANLMTSQEAA